jgi:predicted acetyltransferase
VSITIESIRAGDDEIRWDLGGQAFGGTDAFDADRPMPEPDRIVSAYEGDRLVGTVVTLDFAMSWGRSPVGCGGVSGVVVRPEDRGRGVAKRLLAESFERMRSRGEVIAALFPTTATLYRSVGFEIAGAHEWRKVPLSLIPSTGKDLSWRRVEFDDPAIRTLHEQMSGSLDGWIATDDVWWRRLAHGFGAQRSKNRYAYVGARDGTDVSAVIYRYDKSDDRLYELGVDLLAGVDPAAVASALGFLASNGTTAGHLTTTLPRDVLTLHVPNVQHTTVTDEWPWMLRLVDVAGAFEQRRWPSSVAGRVEFDIEDVSIPANAGRYVVEFEGGSAQASPGGSGGVHVDVTDLAAIYAGNDIHLRRAAGLLEGASDDDVDLLTAACASNPTMPFFF